MAWRRLSFLMIGMALAGATSAQVPDRLICSLGKATVYATVDPTDHTVRLSNARNSKTQNMPASFAGSDVNFSDGEDPVALLYTINRQSMRIDRWVSDGSEGRTHLDDGKCRAAQYADASGRAPAVPLKAP